MTQSAHESPQGIDLSRTTSDGREPEPHPPRVDGRMPVLAMAMLCSAAALCGAAADHRLFQPTPPAPKVAFAEQGAVVLEAVLGQPNMPNDEAKRVVGDTLRGVLKKYQRDGYLVIDVTHSRDGQLLVSAIPSGAVDITAEMRASVAHAIAHASSSSSAGAR